jgi:hypothetical protein
MPCQMKITAVVYQMGCLDFSREIDRIAASLDRDPSYDPVQFRTRCGGGIGVIAFWDKRDCISDALVDAFLAHLHRSHLNGKENKEAYCNWLRRKEWLDNKEL